MPFVLPLLSALAAGTSIVSGIKSLTSGGPSTPKVTTPTPTATGPTADQIKELALKASGNQQERTGGSLSDSSFSQLVANTISNPNKQQDVLRALFGATTNPAPSTGQNLVDPSSLFGGSGPAG